MNSMIQMKKSNLAEILTTTEDEKLINSLHSLMRGYQEKSEELTKVKIITSEEEFRNTEAVANNKTKEAARVLDGELYEIERSINKMLFLLQELEDNYFYELDAMKDEDHKKIIYGYDKSATYTQIIHDNAIVIDRVLNSIKKASAKEKIA